VSIEGTGDPRQWCVDWEVQVDVNISTTVTVARSEIIQADTPEEAAEIAKREVAVDDADVDLRELDVADLQLGEPDLKTFKLSGPVMEWA
jgi:hypothetical protein